MSKEYGEHGVAGPGTSNRNLRQTLNGTRQLAGNNPIADVLEFRKEYTVVDVSKRSGAAAAASDTGGRNGEHRILVHGSRPAWSRESNVNVRLHFGRQSGELGTESWPERSVPDSGAFAAPSETISMKDTIRAARAFFGQAPDEEPESRDDEPDAPADEPDAPADEPEAVGAAGDATAGAEPAPAEFEPERDDRDATEPPTASGSDAQDDGVSTEALLDEIACEIVEDALVDHTDAGDVPAPEDPATAAASAPPRSETPPATPAPSVTPQLFLDEDGEDVVGADDHSDAGAEDTTAVAAAPLVDDVAGEATRPGKAREAATAGETPPEAAANAVADQPPASLAAKDRVPLRRDRRAGPRLPIDGMTPSRSETIARLEQATRAARGRGHAPPKWSESARHHMSDMLASAPRDAPATRNGRIGTELPRIDTRPERHRQSSAMILLGLPAMLMIGFGGAYVYHASNYDPSRVFDQARNAIPASIAAVPTIVAEKPVTKISESIIQKQQAKAVAAEPPAPVARKAPLPPPVAPPLDLPAPTEQAAAAQTVAEPSPATGSITLTKAAPPAVSPAPAREPEAAEPRIEPAAAALTSALTVAPADMARNAGIVPQAETPLQAETETAVRAAEPVSAPPATIATDTGAERTAAAKADQASSPTRLASLVPPAQALPEEPGETGQLIARGNERMRIGDIAAARLLFELAAQSGSAVAATAMGRSYDPVYFLRAGVRGVKPDAAKAREWYERARAGGDDTAAEDLRNLTAWLEQQ